MNSSWGEVPKSSHSQLSDSRRNSYSETYREGIGSILSGASSSVCQPPLNTISASGSYGNNHKMFSNEFFSGYIESSCSRSLLSLTPRLPDETALSLTGETSSLCSAQCFISRLHHNNDMKILQGEAVIPNLVTDGSNNTNLLSIQQMFH